MSKLTTKLVLMFGVVIVSYAVSLQFFAFYSGCFKLASC